MKHRLLVLSMDAMVGEDLDYLRTKPNFSRLFSGCAQIRGVRTIYPSITYPSHTSILTGCRPGTHGILDNNPWNTQGINEGWNVDSRLIQAEDLFAAAKRAGCTTAAVYWPVCGNNPNIDYNINEYTPGIMPGYPIEEALRRTGANEKTMEIVRENLHRLPTGSRAELGICLETTYDHFLNGCACGLIRRYQPELLMVHNSILDTARHRYGVFNRHVTACLDLTDMWLGEIMAALEEAGVYETTNFVLVSDHGQVDFARRIRLNTKLVRDGLITLDDQGRITSWKAFTKSAGMSDYVYLSDPKDPALQAQIHSYLKKLAAEGVWGFETIRTRAQAAADYGLDGDFAFILETDGYTAFADAWCEPITNPRDYTDYRLGNATHGYEPEKGPQPVFVAKGPAFRSGAVLPTADIIDEAPTFARILGARMPQAEGRCIEEILA